MGKLSKDESDRGSRGNKLASDRERNRLRWFQDCRSQVVSVECQTSQQKKCTGKL